MKPKTVGRAAGQEAPKPPNCVNTHDTGVPAGTILLTQDGAMPVEFVGPGDRIITRGTGLAALAGISRMARRVPAVRFAAGALGRGRPDGELILPAAQLVLIRGARARAMTGMAQAMIAAGALADGEDILEVGRQEMLLHQLHFDRPRVVYAGGLELGCGYRPAQRLGAAA